MLYRLIFVVLFSAVSSNFVQQSQFNWKNFETNGGEVQDSRELSEIFEAQKLWATFSGVSTQCREDMNATLQALKNRTYYAARMLDACAKVPDGLLTGNMAFLGQYDECLTVSSPDDQIKGKYCLLYLGNVSTSDMDGGLGSISYRYGLCVADSCSADDLNTAFSAAGLNFLHAVEGSCQTADKEYPLSDGAWGFIAVIILLSALVLTSTTYEVWERFYKKNEKPHELLTSFSVYRNGKIIFEVKEQTGQMECLNGMRTISMFWVIYCHNAILALAGFTYNGLELIQDITNHKYILMSNGYLSVDSFFFLGGVLVTFVFFRDIGRTGSYDAPRSYINRFVRLTPPYAFMVVLHITLLGHLTDGPFWYEFYSMEESVCSKWWWTGLLYVQNIVNPDEMCLLQSWYLSADMQMYWIAPIFLYILYLMPKWGVIFTCFMTVASAFVNFAIAYVYKLSYTPFFDQTGDENRMDNYPFWSRMSPWFVGVLLGALLSFLKGRKIEVKLPVWAVICGWLVASAIWCSCLFGMIWFLDHPDFTVAQSAAFLSFHRLGWAISLAWIVFACVYGYGGPINGFLSWGVFQPLGKLSYSMYLVHITVIYVFAGGERVLKYGSLLSVSLSFFYVLGVSFLAAIPLCFLVEMPSLALDRYFLRSIRVFPYPKRRHQQTAKEEKINKIADP